MFRTIWRTGPWLAGVRFTMSVAFHILDIKAATHDRTPTVRVYGTRVDNGDPVQRTYDVETTLVLRATRRGIRYVLAWINTRCKKPVQTQHLGDGTKDRAALTDDGVQPRTADHECWMRLTFDAPVEARNLADHLHEERDRVPAQVYDYLRSGRLCRLQRYLLERAMDVNGVFDLENSRAVPVAMDAGDTPSPVDAVVLSVDIEVRTSATSGFPKPQDAQHEVLVVAVSVCRMQSDDIQQQVVFAGQPCDHLGDDIVLHQATNEDAMLQAWWKWVARRWHGAVVVGWNVIQFDLQYLLKRSERRGIDVPAGVRHWTQGATKRFATSIDGVILCDGLELYRTGVRAPSYRLEDVAQAELGRGKIECDYHAIDAMAGTPGGMADLARYCAMDTVLPHQILRKRQLYAQAIELARASRCTIKTTLEASGTMIRTYCNLAYGAAQARPKRLHLPEARAFDPGRAACGVGDGFTGGCVLTAEKGLHENVGVFDFLSLYPTIIVAHNISHETRLQAYGLDGSDVVRALGLPPPATGVARFLGYRDRAAIMSVSAFWRRHPQHYATAQAGVAFRLCRDGDGTSGPPKGILASIVDGFMRRRKLVKAQLKKAKADGACRTRIETLDALQLSLKIGANSAFGFCGAARKQAFMPPSALGSAICFLGRKYLGLTAEIAKTQHGLDCVYGDTDSVFLQMKHGGDDGAAIEAAMNAHYPKPMMLEHEATLKRILMVSKKRYAFVTTDDPQELTTKGLQCKRRDMPGCATETQRNMLVKLLVHGDEAGACQVLEDAVGVLQGVAPGATLTAEMLEPFVIRRELTKPTTQYADNPPPHVAAARRATKVAISVGDRVAFVILKSHKACGVGGRAWCLEDCLGTTRQLDVAWYMEQLRSCAKDVVALGIKKGSPVLHRCEKLLAWVPPDVTLVQESAIARSLLGADACRGNVGALVVRKRGGGALAVEKKRQRQACLGAFFARS